MERPLSATIDQTWRDEARARDVPLRIYLPHRDWGRCPVVIMSHGFGWSRTDYAFLGRSWARRGYVSVHPQHLGSDRSAWRRDMPVETLRQIARDPELRLQRVEDIRFVLGALPTASWSEHADPGSVGVAGHSYGAHTTLTLAGQAMQLPNGEAAVLLDSRVQAVTMFSPAAPTEPPGWTFSQILQHVTVPGLHITGAGDASPMGMTAPSARRTAYDHISHSHQYLLVLNQAGHTTFARDARPGNDDPGIRLALPVAASVSVTFWDAYLRRSPAALQWLASDECAQNLSEAASWERKLG